MRWLAFVLGLVFVAPAYAAEKVTVATVTTSSGNCLAQNNQRVWLAFDATAATANIGYCMGSCTAAIGAGGTTTIFYGQILYWITGATPISQFCFVAGSGAQPLTITEGLR